MLPHHGRKAQRMLVTSCVFNEVTAVHFYGFSALDNVEPFPPIGNLPPNASSPITIAQHVYY